VLSRLHATSCAIDLHYPGSDGCQGGWPHWPMEMMAQRGLASDSCLPYYIGGESVEHYRRRRSAPQCESHCQEGYSLGLGQDAYVSNSIAEYDWITGVHGDAEKMLAMRTAIFTEGPVSFAFQANSAFMGYAGGVFSVCTGQERPNHAVYAFGWGTATDPESGELVEFVEASNSWGENWGLSGHFRIHPRCVTDVTISGPIEANIVSHPVGTVDSSAPPDADNEDWPWPKLPECPFENGCLTDMEGDADYANNEQCTSRRLNGKRIRVESFDLEDFYDKLTVNGQQNSGHYTREELDQFTGVVVNNEGRITFSSDSSVTSSGFKLCAMDP
jgi:hypothetical protein